jgi:hypothetical protein
VLVGDVGLLGALLFGTHALRLPDQAVFETQRS